MGVTRTIEVYSLDDVADRIAEEKQIYRKRFEDMVAHNEVTKGAYSQKKLAEAANMGMGLDLAENIVRDCKMKEPGYV